MRATKPIDATVDQLDSAKETANFLMQDNLHTTELELFYTDNLPEIETGIKKLNDFSSKSWLLSSLLLYSLIYDKELYRQSGLDWAEYASQSRQRLGLEQRDISDQLSTARFFIKYHKALERKHFNPAGCNSKLAKAELAVELSGSAEDTINHLINDTYQDFKDWYQSFKPQKRLLYSDYKRDDIEYTDSHFKIGGVEAVKISEEIPEADRIRLQRCMKTIFEAFANGYEPAVIPVYDNKEAKRLIHLRDKDRQNR